MVKLLLLLIILILVNAFLAASEVSVVSLNKNRLRELAEDGDRKAQRLLKFAEEPNIFLSTIQVGITLAGFLASAAAADGFAGGLMAWLYERLGTGRHKPFCLSCAGSCAGDSRAFLFCIVVWRAGAASDRDAAA